MQLGLIILSGPGAMHKRRKRKALAGSWERLESKEEGTLSLHCAWTIKHAGFLLWGLFAHKREDFDLDFYTLEGGQIGALFRIGFIVPLEGERERERKRACPVIVCKTFQDVPG